MASTRGRRTGVTVSDDVAKSSGNNRMEDAAALFDAAESPPKRKNDSVEITAKPRKPKEQVRFSLAEEITDQQDTYTNLNPQHPSRRLVKLDVNASRQQRASVDTNDLSSVSTAVLSVPEAPEEPSEAQFADDPDRDPDDELIPPPPDDKSSDSDSEVGSESHEMVATQREEVDHDFPAADNDEDFPEADNNPEEMDEFPAAQLPEEEYDNAFNDDNDGKGFQIPGEHTDDNEESGNELDPDTPEAVREERRRKAKRAEKLAAVRKKKESATVKSKTKKVKGKVKARESSDSSDNDSEATPVLKKSAPKKKKPNPFATTFESKGQPLPQTFTEIPISNLIQTPPADEILRRSKRARTKPLEYWRGEKYEYGANDFQPDDEYAFEGVTNMPVPIKIVHADPTPYKKRKVSSSVPKKKKGDKKSDRLMEVAAQEPFDSSKLPYPINEGTVAQIWDERFNDTRSIKVASYFATMKPRALPLVKSRKKSDGKVVGLAAQSFAMTNEDPGFPGYIVGSLVLPPKGIKDEESVRLCSQIFTVVRCQPNALEVAYLDEDDNAMERFLLSKGDNVLVPPENKYRLQNHSKTAEALLSWTIIRNNA